jgi:hypothetical protein
MNRSIEDVLGADPGERHTGFAALYHMARDLGGVVADLALLALFDVQRVGPFLTYCFSAYGVGCLLMAFVLNRTLVLASTNTTRVQMGEARRRARGEAAAAAAAVGSASAGSAGATGATGAAAAPRGWRAFWRARAHYAQTAHTAALRALALAALALNVHRILVALDWVWRCRGRTGCLPSVLAAAVAPYDPDRYAGTYMHTPRDQVEVGPTSEMYWPVFLAFCLLLFVETFVAAVRGRTPANDFGLTIFEHLFALHEVTFRLWSARGHTRPTEQVLVCCLFLALNHAVVHIAPLRRVRLVPLTALAAAFMRYAWLTWRAGTWTAFPVIIILAYVPQFLFLAVVAASAAICALAFAANGFALEGLNYAAVLQAGAAADAADAADGADWIARCDAFLANTFHVRLSDDFYTLLLALGTLMILIAGKLCYIKELGVTPLPADTWVERRAYANVIAAPSERLLEGRPGRAPAPGSAIGARWRSVGAALARLAQLLGALARSALVGATEAPPFLAKAAQPAQPALVEVDAVAEDDLSINLLLQGQLSEVDHLEDYTGGDAETDVESDSESDADDADALGEIVATAAELADLVSAPELPPHMASAGAMTRARYAATRGAEAALAELILRRRRPGAAARGDAARYDCVVCQSSPREIITWPCKCFAVCESCRVSLVTNGLEGCVCCRRDVKGVTRVFIP